MTFSQFSKTAVLVAGGLFGLLLVCVVIFVIWAVGINNQAVSLENGINAQQQACEIRYDTMKKIIFQQAEISEKYAEDFKKVFPEIIAGRYKGEGSPLFKFIKESNPKFDIKLYAKLMTTVEGQRSRFETEQKHLIDLHNQHETLKGKWPQSMIIGGRPTPEITVVTSDDAKDAFRAGVDNDKAVFAPKK